MSFPKISIIIGTFNQCEVLERVLTAYQTQTMDPQHFEVVVVDSGSSDGTHALFGRFKPAFRLNAIIQQNKGKAAARNRAVAEASGEIIIITDADMIPDPNFVATHWEAHQNSAKVQCFEGRTFNMNYLHWPPIPNEIYPYIKRNYAEMAPLGWYYFLTGNVSLPKSVFMEEGGFDTDFTGYGWEDLELGYRLFQKKIPLSYLKSAVNYHYHVVHDQDEIARNEKKGESALVMLQKHPELKWFLGLNPLSVVVFRWLEKQPSRLNWFEKSGLASSNPWVKRFSHWLLGEFSYLKGLLGALDRTQA
ncbi:MAG: glycosyltransferase family 2 protein [Candidatus Margulisiibacteriota bacterium]